MNKNDELTVKIDDISSEGSAVAHVDSLVIFIAGGCVGDILKIRIIKVKKNYCIGKIIEIVTPSPLRIESDCDIFPSCGGCAYRHINFDEENRLKLEEVRQNLKRIGKTDVLPDKILSGDRNRYRNKAQFPIRKDSRGVHIGFFAQKSHRVIDCGDCLLQSENFKNICTTVKDWIEKFNISVYDEETQKGLVRHLYIRKAFVTNQTMVCLVINGNTVKCIDTLVSSLKQADDSIKTIVLNKNTQSTNVVLGREFTNIFGDGYITDILCGNKIRISPSSFYQVNHDMCEKLYSCVKEFAEPKKDDICFDIYCGTGTIGLSLANDIKQLIGIEIVESAVRDAEVNAEINNIKNATFICGDAPRAAIKLREKQIKPTFCIVDPPRKGIDSALIDTLIEMNPEKIIYVSCDSATLSRDVAIFEQKGYEPKHVVCVNMFPATVHVETVVLLSQQRPKDKIKVELNMTEMDITSAETEATYQEIKDYILKEHGVKVSSLYIAQVKEKLGIKERENYNKTKEENTKQPQRPKEKEKLIVEALTHFQMIE